MAAQTSHTLSSHWVWLSHVLNADTPAYGGGASIVVSLEKQMAKGDSCNTSVIQMPCHVGSHVDAPRHFVANGRTIDAYPPEEWIFSQPLVLEVSASTGSQLLSSDDFEKRAIKVSNRSEIDFLFLRTGFSAKRKLKEYWEKGPGLSHDFSRQICCLFPGLKALGMDFISVSSLAYRDEGRRSHQYLLGKGVRLFEDLTLEDLAENLRLLKVVALPLRIENSDGSPCTVMGQVDGKILR